MSNERTALIIVGGLGIAFVIAIFERLKEPLPEIARSTEGSVASFVYALGCMLLFAGFILAWRREAPQDLLKTVAVWAAIFSVVALVIAFATGNWTTTPSISPGSVPA